MKQELSFSEILQKQIDKHNKKQEQSLIAMGEAKQRARAKGNCESDKDNLKDNQINIMDLIR